MTISRDSLIFSVVAALVVFKLAIWTIGSAEGNGFSFSLTPASVEAGERATLEVRLQKTPSEAASPRIDDSLFTQSQNFTPLHSEQKEENGFYVWRYDFTSYKVGTYAVPPFSVRYGANSYSTERQELTVTTNRTEKDEALREDYPKLWPPIPWRKIFLYGSFIFILPFVLRYISRKLALIPWKKYHRKAIERPFVPPVDPILWLKRELKRLKERLDQEGETSALLDDLTWVLRRFLFLKYAEPFTNRTTGEFKSSLAKYKGLDPLLEPFQTLDSYKFSNQKDKSIRALVLNGIQTAEQTLCGT